MSVDLENMGGRRAKLSEKITMEEWLEVKSAIQKSADDWDKLGRENKYLKGRSSVAITNLKTAKNKLERFLFRG